MEITLKFDIGPQLNHIVLFPSEENIRETLKFLISSSIVEGCLTLQYFQPEEVQATMTPEVK